MIFILIVLSLIISYFFSSGAVFLRISDGFFFSLNVLANILIIRKKTECWFLWILSNFFAASLFTYKESYFIVALKLVYIIVNISALIRWVKVTKSSKFGWVDKFNN